MFLLNAQGGRAVIVLGKWSKKRYLKELGMVYPHLVKTCGKGKLVDWPGNKWTKGSYSFPKPGEVTRAGPLLHAGFLKRIHFAGEHTCYAFTGYMEAALQSGIRVADQIARRDGVLGRKRRSRSSRSRPKTNVPSLPNVVPPSPS